MDLDGLLAACLSNDNQVRKPAEDAVKALSSKPEVVPELLQRIQHANDPQVRHLGAVLLRKRIAKHWQHLSPEAHKATQTVLLQSLAHEPMHVVRRAVADVAAVVAKQTVPKNQWPELLGTVQQWSQGASADHRELALILFSSLAEIIGEYMSPALSTLISIISGALRDGHQGVRLAALRAVEQLVQLIEKEEHVTAFHGLVANLLECAASAVRMGHEEEAVRCFQLVVDACEAPAPLLAPHMAAVVQLACQTAGAAQLELETRDQALEVITVLASCKPKQLTKHKELVTQIVSGLCAMACEDAPGGERAEREAGVRTPRAMAGQTLDGLALCLPTQHIGPQVLTFARTALQSESPGHRCGAMTAVAVLCEGGAAWLRKRLDDLLPLVMAGLKDGNSNVRAAAAFAVGQMSESMPTEVVEHHAEVLPAVLAVMAGESDPDLQERACYALDTFCEALEPQEIAPYMGQVMEQLVRVLARGAHVSHAGVQEVALSAIASTATAAGKDFLPHVHTVLPALSHFMAANSKEMINCRCRATEVMGVLLEHLGSVPESGLSPLVPGVMEASMAGWHMGHSELREYSHGMWASCAKGLGAAFGPFIPVVVPLAFQSLDQDEGEVVVGGDGGEGGEAEEAEEDRGAAGQGQASEDITSEDDDEEGLGARNMHVRSGVLDEKCMALQALGLYAQHTGALFAPQLEESVRRAVHMAEDAWHEELQIQACEALPRLVVCTAACFPAGPGAPPSAAVHQALALACPPLLERLSSPDRHVTCAALNAWRELLGAWGAAPLATWLQPLSDMVAAALLDKAPCCQYIQDEDESDDDDDGGDAAEELLTAAADLLPVMAGAAGAGAYAPVLEASHLPALLHRLGPGQPEGVRGVALGALAEVAERMQAHMSPHLRKLFPVLLKELRTSDPINRQNAAFAIGVLVEGCGAEAAGPFIPQLLQGLHPLFGAKESPGTRDNAVGCVARMVLCAPPESPLVPLDAVIPAMCAALPPSEDWAEAGPAYRALCQLVGSGDAALARVSAHVPTVIRALGAASVEAQLPPATRTLIRETIHGLRARHAAELDPLLAALPPTQQHALA